MKKTGSILLLAFGVSGCVRWSAIPSFRYICSVVCWPFRLGRHSCGSADRSIVVFIQSGHQQDFTETRVASDLRRDGHAEAMNHHMPNFSVEPTGAAFVLFTVGLESAACGFVRALGPAPAEHLHVGHASNE